MTLDCTCLFRHKNNEHHERSWDEVKGQVCPSHDLMLLIRMNTERCGLPDACTRSMIPLALYSLLFGVPCNNNSIPVIGNGAINL